MNKRIKEILNLSLFVLLLFCSNSVMQAEDYPLIVNVQPKAGVKFPSSFGEFFDNPGKYLTVRVTNTQAPTGDLSPRNIYFGIKFKQLTPTDDTSIESRDGMRPQRYIRIPATGTSTISTKDILEMFSYSSPSDYLTSGIELSSSLNYEALKIPEGSYQLCFIAYDADEPIGRPTALSDPDLGCARIQICYSASRPELTMPVSTQLGDPEFYLNKELSLSRLIKFMWTPVVNNCGISKAGVKYDLEIVELKQGQTELEAITFNQIECFKRDLRVTTAEIDTTQYPGIFTEGKTYVARVTARSDNDLIEIKDGGKSEACSFFFKSSSDESLAKKDPEPAKPDLSKLTTELVDCGVELPKDQKAINKLEIGDKVKIGKFDLEITSIEKQKGSFYGSGVVSKPITEDFPCFKWVNLLVRFQDLKVNKDSVAFDGYAEGIYDKNWNPEVNGLFSSFTNEELTEDQTKAQSDKIKAYVDEFEKGATILANIADGQARHLPFNIQKEIAGNKFDLSVSNMVFTPKGAGFSLYYMMLVPELGQWISFGAKNICMNDKAFKSGKLILLSDIKLPALGYEEGNLTLKSGDDGTYVEWDKDGFVGIQLDASLGLPKNYIHAVGDPNKAVNIHLKTKVEDWGDWIAAVSIDEFSIAGVPDITFSVTDASYDHSESNNPIGYEDLIEKLTKEYKPEKEYQSDFQGLFLKKLTIGLPNFLSDEQNKPLIASIENAFFDQTGFNALVSVSNIISVDDGNLGGWGCSIDTLSLSIVQSTLGEGKMAGILSMPLSKMGASPMTYSSVLKIGSGKPSYQFTVAGGGEFIFLDHLKTNINTSSNITIGVDEKGFLVKAQLSGKFGIKADKVDVNLIGFEKLSMSNRDNKNEPDFNFNLGTWSLGPLALGKDVESSSEDSKAGGGASGGGTSQIEAKLGPFGIQIKTPQFTLQDNGPEKKKAKLALGLGVTLVGGSESNQMAGGNVDFTLNCDLAVDKSFKTKPKLEKVSPTLNAINVHGEFGPLKLEGGLAFYNEDKTYGDGIKGYLKGEFPMDFKAQTLVQFGRVDGYSYFYADLCFQVSAASAVPLIPPLALNGIGGGFYFNMKQEEPKKAFSLSNVAITEAADSVATTKTTTATEKAGESISGYSYKPYKGGFGFEGVLFFVLQGAKEAANGSLGFRASFANNTLNTIELNGMVNALSPNLPIELPVPNAKLPDALLHLEASIKYDHPNRTFDFVAETTVDLGIAKATSPIHLYANGEKKKFFFCLGKALPNEYIRFSFMDISLGDMFYAKLNANAYFAIGNSIPFVPEIPAEVRSFLDDKSGQGVNQSSRNTRQVNDLSGVVFGGNMAANMGADLKIVDFRMKGTVGFDMSLRHLGGRMSCPSNPNKTITGIAGFYGNGQIYGFLDANINARIPVIKKRVEIANFQAGTIMRAGFINPSWCNGAMKIKASVLGGMVKFSTTANFSYGEECSMGPTNPLADINIIEAITPGSENKRAPESISIFDSPQIVCNIDLHQDIYLLEYEDEGKGKDKQRTYYFKVENIEYTCIEDRSGYPDSWLNKKIEFDNQGLTTKTKRAGKKFRMVNKEALRPHSTYRVKVTVKAFERIDGKLQNPLDENNKPYVCVEEKIVYFKTKELPNTVAKENIMNSYPLNNQVEAFVQANKKGFIELKYEQSNIFKGQDEESLFGEFINLTEKGEKPIRFKYKYVQKSGENDKIVFDLHDLKKKCIYKAAFYTISKKQKEAVIKSETKKLTYTNKLPKIYKDRIKSKIPPKPIEGSVEYKKSTIHSAAKSAEISKIFEYHFHISEYNSFKDKYKDASLKNWGSPASSSWGSNSWGNSFSLISQDPLYTLSIPDVATRDEMFKHTSFKNKYAVSNEPLLDIKVDVSKTTQDWQWRSKAYNTCDDLMDAAINGHRLQYLKGNVTSESYRNSIKATKLNYGGHFRGRLTENEIKTGHLESSEKNRKGIVVDIPCNKMLANHVVAATLFNAGVGTAQNQNKNSGYRVHIYVNGHTIQSQGLSLGFIRRQINRTYNSYNGQHIKDLKKEDTKYQNKKKTKYVWNESAAWRRYFLPTKSSATTDRWLHNCRGGYESNRIFLSKYYLYPNHKEGGWGNLYRAPLKNATYTITFTTPGSAPHIIKSGKL